MSDGTPQKPRMSLYANLLDQTSAENGKDAPGATISGAPILYKQSDKNDDIVAAAKSKLSAAALRFQPTKRPTVASQKTKNTGFRPKSTTTASPVASQSLAFPSSSIGSTAETSDTTSQQQSSKPTLEDWTGDADEDAYYLEQKRQQQQRGGRKKRKKNKDTTPQPVNWDDIYDPTRPNNYEEYKHSEESIQEARDWKELLYAHRLGRRGSSSSESDQERSRFRQNVQFPPPDMSFAPPPALMDNSDKNAPSMGLPDPLADATTGDEAYNRRIRMHQTVAQNPIQQVEVMAPPTNSQLPPVHITRAPVRYNLPAPPQEIPTSEAELEEALMLEGSEGRESLDPDSASNEPRSLRPGQKGFAERMMKKYGWTKGSGLGAQGTGITTALSVKVEKAKRKPDAEGGGYVSGTQGRGRITGGKKSAADSDSEAGKFGSMSEVIVLLGMVDGMDLQRELGEGNLMQEIGEECSEKYGRVERVFIDQSAQSSVPVFIKFTSPLSALRAVNALEGRVFNGNTIKAKFFDKDSFDKGDYASAFA